MSVAIPVIDHVDPDLRRIYLKVGVREIHMVDDIYFEMRNLRRTDESLRGWFLFCEAGGNVQKTATTYTPRYLTMLTDPRAITTKIVPDNSVSHSLIVKGEVISDLGTSGADLFDKTLLSPGINVDITLQPPGAEIIRLDQALIEYASFGGYIHVNPLSAHSGVGYASDGVPIGSPLAPVNNWVDAHLISESRGIKPFLIYNNTTIATVDFKHGESGHTFRAVSPFIQVTVSDSANVSTCDFYNMTLIGQLDGINVVRDCSIGPITEASGIFESCAFWSTIDLSGDTSMFNCFSQLPTGDPVVVNPYEWDLNIHNFRGTLEIGTTSINHFSNIGVSEGSVILSIGVTEGELCVHGNPFIVTDLSSGNAIVNNHTGIQAIDDIKAKTDQLVFTNANELDVNVKSQNEATVYGKGTTGNKWRGTP